MTIKDLFSNLLNSLLDGSFERVRIINAMNQSLKDYFYSGELNRLCKVSISQGDREFQHEMSSFWFRSRFKISIENDANLSNSEVNEISKYVLCNTSFIRQLMAMGFDTLVVAGANCGKGRKYSLKGYANLRNYFIE